MAQGDGYPRCVLVIVWDGLRPDFVTPEVTPFLHGQATQGVWFEASHCAYPSETRVNSSALATGCYPGRSGIPGNSMWVNGFDRARPARIANTGDHTQLARIEAIDGPLLRARSTGDVLAEAGGVFVVASSGSPGSALLQDARPDGITINPAFVRPDSLAASMAACFGPCPPDSRPATAKTDWVTRGLLDILLPEMVAPAMRAGRPVLAQWWLTDPDHTAHHAGLGAPETIRSLRENDRRLEALMARLTDLGIAGRTDILLTADHGFSTAGPPRGFDRALVDVGLREGPESDDVITTGQGGGAMHLHSRAHGRAPAIVRWLQEQPWVGTILVREGGPADGVAGTLPLALAWNGQTGPRAPDIKFSVAWSDEKNEAGIPGTVLAGSGRGASHGSASPYDMRNSLFAWGPGFKKQLRSTVPAGIVDVAPTALHLLGLPSLPCDGRVLEEALAGGPDPTEADVRRTTRSAHAGWPGGGYRQELAISTVGATTYLDHGTAMRD